MTALLSQPPAAPDFTLQSHQGLPIRLRDGFGGLTLLVFIRGHWCPYCRRYLMKLQKNAARFAELQVRLLAISPEPPATSRALVDELGLGFPILCDPNGAIIDRYATRNGPASSAIVLPHPAVFLIDPAGSIRFRRIDRNFKLRTTMHTLFQAIGEVAR